MRAALLVAAMCNCSSGPSHPTTGGSAPPVAFSGEARIYNPWCAGVAPRPEDEARERAGEPLAQPLHVHAGDTFRGGAPLATITPSADGQFTGSLAPGNYCVVTAAHEKLDAPIDPEADAKCIRETRASCDALWVVEAAGARNVDGTPVAVSIQTYCSFSRPCFPPGPAPP